MESNVLSAYVSIEDTHFSNIKYYDNAWNSWNGESVTEDISATHTEMGPNGPIVTELWSIDNCNRSYHHFHAATKFGAQCEPPTEIVIPEWIKNNSGWWADGTLNDPPDDPEGDDTFLVAIKYLTENLIIQLGEVTQSETPSDDPIPEWIKNNAGWWADGLISDEDFTTGLKWLIENGIIILDTPIIPATTTSSVTHNTNALEIQSNETITMSSDATDPACEPNCFIPNIVNIDVGDTITFVNSKNIPTVIASGNLNSGLDDVFNSGPLGTGLTYEIIFTEPGIYNYFDLVSPWMQGTINVGSIVNLPPTADAGPNQIVDENSLVILPGSGTDPEDGVLLYSWVQTSGPTVSLSGSSFPGGISNSQTPFFTAPDVATSETLTFQLTVKDDIMQPDTDTVSVTVNNVDEPENNIPVADAGLDQSVDENTMVALDGSASFDPDDDPIEYEWEQTQGTSVTFDSLAQNPTFTAPEVNGITNLQFKLIVYDDSGFGSIPDYVTITVNNVVPPPENTAPIANNDLFQIVGTDPVNFDVLFNDFDDDSISIVSVDTTGTAGVVTNNGNDVTFDATEGFTGTTTFTYTITDGFLTDAAMVTVDVFAATDGNAIWYKTNPDLEANVHFGASLGILANGNVIAGAPGNIGKVSIINGDTGNILVDIPNPTGTFGENFGFDVASLYDDVIIGTPGFDVSGNTDAGAIYVYSNTGTQKFGGVIQNPEPEAFDDFGESVTATSRIFVGAPGNDVIVTETSSITHKDFAQLNIMSDSSLELFIDEKTSTAQILHKTTLDILAEIPLVFKYDESLVITDDDNNDIINDEIPPRLVIDSITGTMTLFDGLTNDEILSAPQKISSKENNFVLFTNQKTGTSYLYDGITGNLLLTEFASAGSVYVYDGVTGAYISPPIDNPRPASSDKFGASLASFGNNIVIGVPGDDENGGSSGSVYVYDGNTKSEIHYIVNPSVGSGSGDDFGYSVGAAGNHIVVGSPDDDDAGSNDGAIYIFDGTTGEQKAYLPNPNPDLSTTADMGESVSINANGLLVAGAEDSESAFVFFFDGIDATFVKQIENPETDNANFGASLALLNDNVVIGIPFDNPFGTGAVALYSSNPPSNNPPVAINDSADAINDSPISIDVLFNDTDADGHSLTVDSVNTSGTLGSVINNISNVTFTANQNFDGITTFSYKASDGNGGLSNIGIVTVTVSDTLPPVISLVGNNPQTIDVGAGYTELGGFTDDGSPIIIDETEFVDEVGSYVIHYDSSDINGNDATTVTRMVDVVDTVPPTITVPPDQVFEAISLYTPLSELDYGYATAVDDVDPSPTITNNAPTEFPLGDTLIIWTATDFSENNSTDNQIITVRDTINPTIILLGDNPQTIELGDSYAELGANATDNIDGDITAHIIIDSSAVNTDATGSYPVMYDVADSSGNSAITAFREVIVIQSNPAPIITSLIADDPDNLDETYSVDDTIIITFDSDTNTPGGTKVQTKSAINNMFVFTESLGRAYVGQWVAPDTFTITISSVIKAGPPVIDITTVTPAGTTPILSADQTSEASVATSPVLSGDFGIITYLPPIEGGPIIISLVADDPDDSDETYSVGDAITITFDSDTNMPGGAKVQTKSAINNMFTFTELLGQAYMGQWVAPDTFTITIKSTRNAGPPVIDVTTIAPAGITPILSADELSEPSSVISPVLSGDFGIIP